MIINERPLRPLYLSMCITYYNLVSIPTPWAVTGPHWQLASSILQTIWLVYPPNVQLASLPYCAIGVKARDDWRAENECQA